MHGNQTVQISRCVFCVNLKDDRLRDKCQIKLGYYRAHLEVEVCIAVMQQVVGGLAETADSADQLWSIHGHRVFNIHPFHLELHRR